MINKLMSYSLATIAIFMLCKYLPQQSMKTSDIFTIIAVLSLMYILFEQLKILNPNSNLESCKCDVPIERFQSQYSDGKIQEQEQVSLDTQIKSKMDTLGVTTSLNSAIDSTVDNVIANMNKQNNTSNETQKQDASSKPVAKNEEGEYIGEHVQSGVITDELKYSNFNHVPIKRDHVTSLEDYGYSFLPPEKWYPQAPTPPVCVSQQKCTPCPVYTHGSPVDVKEWNASRRVTPPDNINVNYVEEKLNSGR